METTIYLLKFALFCFAGGVIFVIGHYVIQWRRYVRKENEKHFNIMYMNLGDMIHDPLQPVTKTNMLKLLSHFKDLRNCPHKKTQDEMINVLYGEFCEIYNELRKYKEEDEFETKDGDLDELSQVHKAQRDSQKDE